MRRSVLVGGVLVAAILVGEGQGRPAAAEVEVSGGVRVTVNTPPPVRYRRRPGPRYMLPLAIDVGAIGAGSDHGGLVGAEISVGVHWASLSPQPTNFDIGLGVVAAAMDNGNTDDNGGTTDVQFVGGYLALAQTLSHGSHWRTWGGVRGEYLDVEAFGERRTGLGVAARLAAELYLSGVGIEPRGVFLGTYAIGVYVEAAARGLGDETSRLQISGGLTIRTPMVWTW